MNDQEILKSFNAPEGAILVSQYKNGNIKIKRRTICSRCNNKQGIYIIGVCNGVPVPSYVDNGVCFKCNGAGYAWETEILRTPENQKKYEHDLELRLKRLEEDNKAREAELKRLEEERRAEQERIEAERKAEEERIRAEKQRSQYIGSVGDKIEIEVVYLYSALFKIASFRGYGEETMYVHTFRDDIGNKLVWKTGKGMPIGAEAEERFKVKATIKEHKEYKDEKQTVLTRCKLTKL